MLSEFYEERIVDNANEYAVRHGTPYCSTELDVRRNYLNMKTSVIAGTNEFLKYGIACYHGGKRIKDKRDWHAIVLLKIVMGTGALFKVDFGTGRLDMPFYRKNKHCLSLMINDFLTNPMDALIH